MTTSLRSASATVLRVLLVGLLIAVLVETGRRYGFLSNMRDMPHFVGAVPMIAGTIGLAFLVGMGLVWITDSAHQNRVREPPTAGSGRQPENDPHSPEVNGPLHEGGVGRAYASDWERRRNIAETIYRAIMILAVLVGIVFGMPFIQAEYTRAQRDETLAKIEIAKREAAEKKILDMDLSAIRLGQPTDERQVLVTLEMKNTGNQILTVPADHLNAYIARVVNVDQNGEPEYGDRYDLRFGEYAESRVTKFTISPGERVKLQTVQKLKGPGGPHLISAEVNLDATDGAFRAVLYAHFD